MRDNCEIKVSYTQEVALAYPGITLIIRTNHPILSSWAVITHEIIAPFTHTKFYELFRPNLGERLVYFDYLRLSQDKLEPLPEVELTFISQLSLPNLARCDNVNTLISDSNLSQAGLYEFILATS